ncbi:hypothetical protein GLYMA_09G055301v4 [Glycine max]|nr:hypothetical protein GLYMA_09G055301v4 [Glycine max]KAH1041631.1 hypothetical protein GYH30_024134 [Glycine max]
MMKKLESFSSIRQLDVCGHQDMPAVVGTLFTHHQKCVIVDTQAHGNNRKITTFIGGLVLCDGRYDTLEHRILRDIDTVYQDDYHKGRENSGFGWREWLWKIHCDITFAEVL